MTEYLWGCYDASGTTLSGGCARTQRVCTVWNIDMHNLLQCGWMLVNIIVGDILLPGISLCHWGIWEQINFTIFLLDERTCKGRITLRKVESSLSGKFSFGQLSTSVTLSVSLYVCLSVCRLCLVHNFRVALVGPKLKITI